MKFERIPQWQKRPPCAVIRRDWGGKITMASRRCLEDAFCTVDGQPHCKRHAQERALMHVLNDELEIVK